MKRNGYSKVGGRTMREMLPYFAILVLLVGTPALSQEVDATGSLIPGVRDDFADLLIEGTGSKTCTFNFDGNELQLVIDPTTQTVGTGGAFCQDWNLSATVVEGAQGCKARGMGTVEGITCCDTMRLHHFFWRAADGSGRIQWDFDDASGACFGEPITFQGRVDCVPN